LVECIVAYRVLVTRCLALPLPVYVLAQARGVGWHGGQARSASLCPSNPPEMGDHADALEFAGDAPSPTVFAGVIVEDLGRNLAGGQHPTHLCHHATRFLHTKAGTYELFRTNFGCPEEDGSLAASRSVSRCCSKGFAVSSIRDSGTAKTARPILQACRNTLSPSWARCSFRRSPGRLRQVLYSITKHAMRRSADEIGATSISFWPKVFSDPASVVD